MKSIGLNSARIWFERLFEMKVTTNSYNFTKSLQIISAYLSYYLNALLELLAVWSVIPYNLIGVGFITSYWLLYFSFYTNYMWPITCLYILWFVWDLETCNKGGRRYE